jgi:hypothetical protein
MGRLLDGVRKGLADPFADTIKVGPSVLTRAEARAIERALSVRVTERRLRLPRVTIIWRGVSA